MQELTRRRWAEHRPICPRHKQTGPARRSRRSPWNRTGASGRSPAQTGPIQTGAAGCSAAPVRIWARQPMRPPPCLVMASTEGRTGMSSLKSASGSRGPRDRVCGRGLPSPRRRRQAPEPAVFRVEGCFDSGGAVTVGGGSPGGLPRRGPRMEERRTLTVWPHETRGRAPQEEGAWSPREKGKAALPPDNVGKRSQFRPSAPADF